jgi:hypothetical protein
MYINGKNFDQELLDCHLYSLKKAGQLYCRYKNFKDPSACHSRTRKNYKSYMPAMEMESPVHFHPKKLWDTSQQNQKELQIVFASNGNGKPSTFTS